MADFINLPCRDEQGRFLVVVEAPRGSLEQFFITASAMSDKKLVIDGWEGPKAARKVIEETAAKYIRRGED